MELIVGALAAPFLLALVVAAIRLSASLRAAEDRGDLPPGGSP